jgi:hypothetical protein
MNKHVSGAGREVASSAQEPPAPEFDAMTWGAEEALKAMVAYQVESLRFIARRTYCNLEFMRHLRHCSNWQEIAQMQQSWFKDCAADCGEELSRLASTGFQLAESDFAPLQRLMYRQTRGGKGGGGRG